MRCFCFLSYVAPSCWKPGYSILKQKQDLQCEVFVCCSFYYLAITVARWRIIFASFQALFFRKPSTYYCCCCCCSVLLLLCYCVAQEVIPLTVKRSCVKRKMLLLLLLCYCCCAATNKVRGYWGGRISYELQRRPHYDSCFFCLFVCFSVVFALLFLSLLVVAQIRGHIAGSFPSLPTTVRALHFYRDNILALSSLADSHRIVLTHALRS